jgi:hypothetical protein
MRRMAATAYASVEGSAGSLVTPTSPTVKLSKRPDDCNLNQSQRLLGLDGNLFDSSTLLII